MAARNESNGDYFSAIFQPPQVFILRKRKNKGQAILVKTPVFLRKVSCAPEIHKGFSRHKVYLEVNLLCEDFNPPAPLPTLRTSLAAYATRDPHLPEVQECRLADEASEPSGIATGEMMAEKKRRRTKGDGSVYRRGRIWFIAYQHPDGKRRSESSKSERKSDADRLLRKRIGAKLHNLPVIPRAEQLTFYDASQAVIDDFVANGKRSEPVVRRRIDKHLRPFFGHRRLVSITASDVTAFIAKRQTDSIVVRKARLRTLDDGTEQVVPEVRKDVSPAEINRELQTLKRVFSLAIRSGRIASKPYIPMLRESPARSGFFEPEQYASVMAHLPAEVRPIIEFAYITGWRIASEVLPLEWRQVDFAGEEVRLDAGTTKNGEGRVFPFTDDLRRLLKERKAEHERLKKGGHVCRYVFFREVAEGRGGEKKPRAITAFTKSWKAACVAAGCPGRIPHDLRRTAVRNFVRKGIPERVSMRLTGHKTPSVFNRYNIVSDGDLRDAARKLDAPKKDASVSAAQQR